MAFFSRPSCAPSTLGRDLSVWRHGHLVPLAFSDAAQVPEEERLWVTYLTLVPRGNETLRLKAILPASLRAVASFLKLNSFHRTCFNASWPLRHPPVTSHPSIGQITLVFRAGHAEGVPLVFSDTASRSLEELGLHM